MTDIVHLYLERFVLACVLRPESRVQYPAKLLIVIVSPVKHLVTDVCEWLSVLFSHLSPSGRTLPLVAWHAELWKVLQSPEGIFHIHMLPSSVPASSTGAQGCHSNHWGGSRADSHELIAMLHTSTQIFRSNFHSSFLLAASELVL